MKQLIVNGVEITYLDQGKGANVIVGHCSSASHKEWLPLMQMLSADWRVLAPDFIGYGQSQSWPRGEPFSADADVDVLVALAKKVKGPLHFVGHSYGAALALEAARKLGSRVKSLTLIEPVSFHLLKVESRPEWREVERLGIAVLGTVGRGDDRSAAKAFMSYWLGRWRWWLAPEKFKAAITATIRKVALEFTIAVEANAPLRDYASITAPTLLIVGSKTRAPARAVADMLAATLPQAELKILKGAGHMSPFTHRAEINRLVLDYLAARR
ncbi:MAG: alpha/beta fold hydrolase [Methyloceanibacter sp.]|uniref:alpha/beta fold hydrolase n=1 Tax=Methyloceanibacter sp. TaxID=1965321 RepID=UPI003D9BE54D